MKPNHAAGGKAVTGRKKSRGVSRRLIRGWPKDGLLLKWFEILIGNCSDDADHAGGGWEEFAASVIYYESREPGLGFRFRSEG